MNPDRLRSCKGPWVTPTAQIHNSSSIGDEGVQPLQEQPGKIS